MAFKPFNGNGTLNGTTEVTLVASPVVDVRRTVYRINIKNRNASAITVTLRYKDGASTRELQTVTLQVDDRLVWEGEEVLDDTNDSITAVLAAAPTTQPDFTVTYAERD